MSYATWANFVYYKVGDRVIYNTTNYEALQANINVAPTTLAPNWQVLPPPVAGVTSLSGGTGALTQSCINGTYTLSGGNIELAITYPVAPTLTYANLYSLVTQNITPLDTVVLLAFENVRSSGGSFGLPTPPYTEIFINESGSYLINFILQVDKTTAGFGTLNAYLLVNGTPLDYTGVSTDINLPDEHQLTGEYILNLISGDYVGVGATTNDTGLRILNIPVSPPTVTVDVPSFNFNITKLLSS